MGVLPRLSRIYTGLFVEVFVFLDGQNECKIHASIFYSSLVDLCVQYRQVSGVQNTTNLPLLHNRVYNTSGTVGV